jgi:predicted Zn-ribbon and HTH transcriptional regulator
MIRVTLTDIISIYLFLFLNTVFFSWLWSIWQHSRREKQALRHRLRCTICAYEFEDTTDTLLPRCPRCGTLNERYKFQTL